MKDPFPAGAFVTGIPKLHVLSTVSVKLRHRDHIIERDFPIISIYPNHICFEACLSVHLRSLPGKLNFNFLRLFMVFLQKCIVIHQ